MCTHTYITYLIIHADLISQFRTGYNLFLPLHNVLHYPELPKCLLQVLQVCSGHMVTSKYLLTVTTSCTSWSPAPLIPEGLLHFLYDGTVESGSLPPPTH